MDMSGDPQEFRVQLGLRIAEVVGKFPTKKDAADAAGVTLETLRSWVNGSAKVPLEGLWRLSRGSNDDFSWLCSGSQEVSAIRPNSGRVFEESVLRDVLVALADVIASEGVTFHPDRFADLAFDLHDYVIDKRANEGVTADLAGITRFIKAAARSQR